MDRVDFTYHFRSLDRPGAVFSFTVSLDPETLVHETAVPDHPPSWTRLTNHQCPGCPLDNTVERHCPAALSLTALMARFDNLTSYDEVDVEVVARERTYAATTTVQKSLSSLVGLYMATSGCPVLGALRPMARFHLPFASQSETLFRAAGAYLLSQYFQKNKGGEFDHEFEGLSALYVQIHEINISLAKRLREIASSDAGLNAVTLLDLFAQGVPRSIRDSLTEIEHLFEDTMRVPGAV